VLGRFVGFGLGNALPLPDAYKQGRISVVNPRAGDDQVTTPRVCGAIRGVGAVPTRRRMTQLDPTELNWTDS
jgi:hypothetical protein